MSTVTIDLPPGLARRVSGEARQRRIGMSECVVRLIDERFALEAGQANPTQTDAVPFHETASPEEWDRAFVAWVGSHKDIQAPPIPLEALRRERMYDDRGL